MNPKFLRVSCAATLAALVLPACGGPAQDQAETPVRIGLLVVRDADRTAQTLQGVQAAADQANAEGGVQVDGRLRSVELIVRETDGSAAAAVAAARELVNRERVVALVAPSISRAAAPVAELAASSRLPVVSPASTSASTTAGNPFSFRVVATDSVHATVLARFATGALDAASTALLFDATDAYSRDMAAAYVRAFSESGGVVTQEAYEGPSRFDDAIQRLAESAPDAWFLPNYAEDVVPQLAAIRAVDSAAVVIGGDAWSGVDPTLASVQGTYFPVHWHPDLATAEQSAFMTAVEASSGTPVGARTALAYDAMGLILHAISRANSTEGARIRQALSETRDYAGATGTITFQDTGDPIRSVSLVYVRGGVPELHSTHRLD